MAAASPFTTTEWDPTTTDPHTGMYFTGEYDVNGDPIYAGNDLNPVVVGSCSSGGWWNMPVSGGYFGGSGGTGGGGGGYPGGSVGGGGSSSGTSNLPSITQTPYLWKTHDHVSISVFKVTGINGPYPGISAPGSYKAITVQNVTASIDNDGDTSMTKGSEGYDSNGNPIHKYTTNYQPGGQNLNAANINYIALSSDEMTHMGIALGDIVIVTKGSSTYYAVVGDTSGIVNTYIGEISYHLAGPSSMNLGGSNNSHNSVNTGANSQFDVFIIKGSSLGNGQALTQAQIDAIGSSYYNANRGFFP